MAYYKGTHREQDRENTMNISETLTTESGTYRLADDIKLEKWDDDYGWTELLIVPEHCACSPTMAVALYENLDKI